MLSDDARWSLFVKAMLQPGPGKRGGGTITKTLKTYCWLAMLQITVKTFIKPSALQCRSGLLSEQLLPTHWGSRENTILCYAVTKVACVVFYNILNPEQCLRWSGAVDRALQHNQSKVNCI